MDHMIYLSVLVSFLGTWIITHKWIHKAPEIGLLGWDMNKPGRPKVAEMGGICVIFGFVLGLLAYMGLKTFYSGPINYVPLLAALCTVLLTCIIGMMDDLLGWKMGLKQWQKPIFTFFAAMPMMVINAGHSNMVLPIFGSLDWGILYPLLIVPLGIVWASNSFNMIAGYNGLETGMGIIMLSVMAYVAFAAGRSSAMMLALCMLGALAAFLYFNWYPAKIFPGDTLTYSVGALIACTAILGDMHKIAILLFIPYVLDFFLQLRSRFKAEAFAKVNEDGSLEKPFEGIFHLTHLAIALLRRIKERVYERDVVLLVYGIELAVVIGLITVYS